MVHLEIGLGGGEIRGGPGEGDSEITIYQLRGLSLFGSEALAAAGLVFSPSRPAVPFSSKVSVS